MRAALTAVAIATIATYAAAQEIRPDDGADVSVLNPAYATNTGPIVAIDSGHNNYHTLDHRFGPFAALLRRDGFRVVDSKFPFSSESLATVDVLVISNALPAGYTYDESLSLPSVSAFSSTEVAAVKTWVLQGGSLLLIADHRPFAGSAADLAVAFGISFDNGTASRDGSPGRDTFTIAGGTLRDDIIMRGRSADERVDSLVTFVGSSFRALPDARPLMVLPEGFALHDCGLPCPQDVSKYDATGHLQGAALLAGSGRVAVFGEAAMFSAQVLAGTPPVYFGFNAPGAEKNKQFILNVARWLGGVLPE